MYYFKNGKLEELDETLEKIVAELKNKLIMYMLTNHNIEWLNDETEKQFYNILFDFLGPYISAKIVENLPSTEDED